MRSPTSHRWSAALVNDRREYQEQPVGRLPWGQVTVLLKLDDPEDRDWYADQAALGGWSRKVLEHHIATRLRSRAGAAANNFPTHLDPQDADQAREILRDPYVFDFLGLNHHASERELEDALIARLQDTLRGSYSPGHVGVST